MVDIVNKLDKFLAATKKVRCYRDMRVNPKFLQNEKPSTISFIKEEEVEAVLAEDKLFDGASVKELLNIRDLIVFQSSLSNEALEDIDFSLLINGAIHDLILLRIYKEVDLFSTNADVQNVVRQRFADLINEYVEEELSKEELEEIKRDNEAFIDNSLQAVCDEEVDDTVTELVIKRKIQDEILSNYVILLGLHLDTLDSDSDEYKDISKFIYNLFFVNKNLERSNEFLYNKYVKATPLNVEMLGTLYGCSKNVVNGIRTEVLLDWYDYGVDLLFRNHDYNTGIMSNLVGIYLDTIQSLLSRNDVDSLFTIVDDNYMLSDGTASKYSNNDKIKTDLENRIYINEERCIRGKTYIKGAKNE